jgi:hypothetical protein
MATETAALRRATRRRTGVLNGPRGRRGIRCATSTFVHGVLARGAIGAAVAWPLEMTLRAIGRAVFTHVMHVGPTLDLRLAFHTRLMSAVRSRARVEPMLPWARTLPTGETETLTGSQPVVPVAERIVEQSRRIEVHVPAPGAPPVLPSAPPRASGAPPSHQPLVIRRELTVRRSALVVPPVPSAADEQRSSSTPVSERVSSATVHRPGEAARLTIPLSPSEIGRLTDDVVRVLNSRVVAHRERQGVI